MWKVALGMAVFLQTGVARAEGEAGDQSAVHVECPPGSAGEDCTADEAVVPAPPEAPAQAAVVAPTPTAFATVSFRNDVGSGAVNPGPHIVTAQLTYRGDRAVFSYMQGYKLNVKSDQVLTAPADQTVGFTVVSHENKGMNVPLERRVVVTVENGASRK
jgi:hypothetical protein